MQSLYLLLANAVLILHGLIVVFNIGTLPVIWAGRFWHWRAVRNPYFRGLHLLLLGFVCVETSLDLTCPLTTLENALRLKADTPSLYSEGFISHWLHGFVFWDVSPGTLAGLYWLFFAMVLLTFFLVRPAPVRGRPRPVHPLMVADGR